jgi:MFS family permease
VGYRAIALLAFYGNYVVAPLIPAFSWEFATLPDALCWLVPGFWLAYAVSTLIYGALSDRFGRTPVLLIPLPSASLTTLLMSFATATRELVTLRILSDGSTMSSASLHIECLMDKNVSSFASHHVAQPDDSRTELYQNCTKILCNWCWGLTSSEKQIPRNC